MEFLNTTVNLGHGQIEYSIYGKGKPVVFIHGGHSNSKELLAHKGLSPESFTIITPSRPEHGNAPLGEKTSPLKSAELIISLLDLLNVEKFSIVGISVGGPIAIGLASLFPGRAEKLVLASAVSTRWLHPKDRMHKRAKELFNPKVKKVAWWAFRLMANIFPNQMAMAFMKEYSTKPPEKPGDKEVKEFLEMLRKQSLGTGFMAGLGHEINESQFGNITAPTLIVHSRYDKLVPFSHALYSYSKIPHARLLELQNQWGHLIWLGKSSSVATGAIAGFLKK